MRKRRNHDAGFTVGVALEAVKGERRMSDLASDYGVHPTLIHQGKKSLLDGAAEIFEHGGKKHAVELDEETGRSLHARSGVPTSLICRCSGGPVSGRHHGLVHPQGSGPAHIQHPCGRLLRRDTEGGHPPLWPPGIMNTDQSSRFTSFSWTDRLTRVGTRISMDGKGRCTDNVFIERLWRSMKYECVYQQARETGSHVKAAIGSRITFYNHRRPHIAPGWLPHAMVDFNRIETDRKGQAVA